MSEARKRFLVRGGLVAALVIVVLGVTLGPSFAGSFLTKKKANNLYVRKSDAGQFLTKADAANLVTKADASNYLTKAQGAETGVARGNGSFASPAFTSNSTGAVPIGGSDVSVTVPEGQNATLVVNFSGASQCSGAVTNTVCGVLVLVDGSPSTTLPSAPSPTGYIFDAANHGAEADSLTVSAPVGPGAHTVSMEYAGTSGGNTISIIYWHLLVQAFPT